MKFAITLMALCFGYSGIAQQATSGNRNAANDTCIILNANDGVQPKYNPKHKPLYHSDSHAKMMTRNELVKLPSRDVRDAISLSPGVYQAKRGQEANIGGARTGGNLYVEDGVQLQRR